MQAPNEARVARLLRLGGWMVFKRIDDTVPLA